LSHCFPLNGNDDDPSVQDIDGLLAAYSTALDTVHRRTRLDAPFPIGIQTSCHFFHLFIIIIF
jgi:hypothetical protein